MVKKLNLIAATIKIILQNNVRPINIARKLKISKQRVNYWIKTPIKTMQIRRRKIPENFEKHIIRIGNNKTVSTMTGTKIVRIINDFN